MGTKGGGHNLEESVVLHNSGFCWAAHPVKQLISSVKFMLLSRMDFRQLTKWAMNIQWTIMMDCYTHKDLCSRTVAMCVHKLMWIIFISDCLRMTGMFMFHSLFIIRWPSF